MTKKKKKIDIAAGTCPKCGGIDLCYGTGDVDDGTSYGYEWTCPDCKAEGVEWHRMEFSAHAVLRKGKYAQYDIFNDVPGPIVIVVKGGVATVEENPTENPVVVRDLDE